MIEDAVLTWDSHGVSFEGVPIRNEKLDITAPEGQAICLKTATWKRAKIPEQTDRTGQSVPIEQHSGSTVFLSGFGTRGEDWPIAFEGLGRYWSTVVGLDHPDAPTSTITPHDKPLNNNSFANSGYVILRAIEMKIKDETLEGDITAVGMSTGCPVLLEAVAQDIREAERGLHERYIKSLILTAPAGMQNMSSFEELQKAVGRDVGTYLWKEYGRDLFFRLRHPFMKNPSSNFSTEKLTYKKLLERLKAAESNPEWKDVLKGHKWIERLEFMARKLSLNDFLAFFHRVWPYQDPHLAPETPSVRENKKLIFRNVTEEARSVIKNTDIKIELFDGDKAVPPLGFLTDTDRKKIENIFLNNDDFLELQEINKRRRESNPHSKPYSKEWMLENKRQNMILDRIIRRVKELFPENQNTRVAITVGSNHLTPKADIDMIADRYNADIQKSAGDLNI